MTGPQAPEAADVILRVDKPVGPTSHDVVTAARRALGIRRIGHSGTLDPFASGLLLLCVGRATRLAEYLLDLPKMYRAVLRLGAATDTGDPTGEVTATSPAWRELTQADVGRALSQYVGPLLQIPPAYSAKKVAGERMYRRARRGEATVLAPVPVEIHSLEARGVALPDVELDVVCSTGTYIRALARDLGETLGCHGHLASLRRLRIGPHTVDTAVPLAALGDAAARQSATVSMATAVSHLPVVELDSAATMRLVHGLPVPAPKPVATAGPVAIVQGDRLIAVAASVGDRLRPRKVFADA